MEAAISIYDESQIEILDLIAENITQDHLSSEQYDEMAKQEELFSAYEHGLNLY